jgi:phenylacetate-CoA ligase
MNLFEIVLALQGFPIQASKQDFEKLQKSFAENPIVYRDAKCKEIFEFHKKNNSFYKSLTNKHNSNNWAMLPIVTKHDLQLSLDKLLTSGFGKRNIYVSNTSGSSGHPFFFAKDKYAHALAWANIAYQYGCVNLTTRSLQARFYGIPLGFIGYWKERLKDMIANRIRFPVFDLQDSIMKSWITKIQNESIRQFNGYTSSLVYFAKYCIRNNIVIKDLCKTLQVCIVTSEVCTKEDRKILEDGFGVPVVNEYGASELGIIAFDTTGNDWPICEELIYLEVVDDFGNPVPNGVEGRIVCTSLFNKAFPLIRYELGDIGTIFEKDGRKHISQLLGRTNDMARLPSGKISPGLTFYYISKSILEKTGSIQEFIIRQTNSTTFKFIINAITPLTQEEELLIKQKMDLYLEPNLNLEIEYVDKIQRPASGKIKHFYSDL